MIGAAPLATLPLAMFYAPSSEAPVQVGPNPETGELQITWPTLPDSVIVEPVGEQPQPGVPYSFPLGLAWRWRLRVRIDGVDLSHRLVGTVKVDREEGVAGLADFTLMLDGVFRREDWYGRPVTIDYISESLGGRLISRRFTGRITLPKLNPRSRLLICECSDALQQRVGAMEVAQIDALVGGLWSADIFDAVEGRSRWDYALERLSSRPASMDCSALGDIRVTDWQRAETPYFRFGFDTTLDGSVKAELGDVSKMINVVEITFTVRFPRLHQRNHGYGWVHPGMSGFTGIQGFCAYRSDTSELPDRDMIRSAVESSGQTMLGGTYTMLPPTGVYCIPPAAWINNYTDLVLEASFTAGRRWSQTVTETYTLRLVHQPGVAASGENVSRDSFSLEVGRDRGSEWESGTFSGGSSGHEDAREDERRLRAGACALQQGRVKLWAASRTTTLMFETLTSMALGLDLTHTIELDDQGAFGIGKCRRLYDTFDLDSGMAATAIGVAIMDGGGGSSDDLVMPAYSTSPPISGGATSLPTQLGGRSTSPPFDEERDGFAGNYSMIDNNVGQEPYPRRFAITAPEIPETLRDEHKVSITAEYQVAIPADPMEL